MILGSIYISGNNDRIMFMKQIIHFLYALTNREDIWGMKNVIYIMNINMQFRIELREEYEWEWVNNKY